WVPDLWVVPERCEPSAPSGRCANLSPGSAAGRGLGGARHDGLALPRRPAFQTPQELPLIDRLDSELQRPIVLRPGVLPHHDEARLLRYARGHMSARVPRRLLGLRPGHGYQPPRDDDGLAGERPL